MTDREFRRMYAQYVRSLISKKLRDGYAPSSISSQVASVKSFFKYNDLPLGHIPIAKKRVVFHNRDITKEEVKKILEVSRPRDKAFFCIMAQTGLRPDTICSLRLKHIYPDFAKGIIPCKVDVPQEIAKGEYRSYFTFMGLESVRFLKAYLATRPNLESEDYLFTSYGSDKRLNRKSIAGIFARTIEKLKEKGVMDFKQKEKGKPRTVRLYNLRKFFRKQTHQAGFEIVQFWMGHIVEAGVDEHYRPQDPEFYRKLYEEKAMPFLRLETRTPSETEKQIDELSEQLKHKDEVIEKMKGRLDNLEKAMNDALVLFLKKGESKEAT